MNIHVPETLRNKYPTFEFLGVPWKTGNLTWMKAHHKTLGHTYKFCFELECGVEEGMYNFIVKNEYFG
jgi:hypothetical protein